ncbi:hypothetical protein [Halobacillus sp. Cin3]|uniref:hypothetical protein n=1 Tax=Halobacillus sp. Cin3 TaxID=2928441 RepID=UPI00248F0FCD|nr:hypothetical protein [Halobacillus sp. Cin3]
MKKYYTEAILLSVLIGVLIRGVVLLWSGRPLLSGPVDYIFSVLIAVLSCSAAFIIHMHILAGRKSSFLKKAGWSCLLIAPLYGSGNLLFSGYSILIEAAFYGYGAGILALSLLLIYQLNKRIQTYEYYLMKKKNR